jgi:hypothetical protein
LIKSQTRDFLEKVAPKSRFARKQLPAAKGANFLIATFVMVAAMDNAAIHTILIGGHALMKQGVGDPLPFMPVVVFQLNHCASLRFWIIHFFFAVFAYCHFYTALSHALINTSRRVSSALPSPRQHSRALSHAVFGERLFVC